MIHEAYMPVYMGSRFLARDGTGPIGGSTRGPRGPKNILDFHYDYLHLSLRKVVKKTVFFCIG